MTHPLDHQASLDHPAIPETLESSHGDDSSTVNHLLVVFGLMLIVIGDLAAFNSALSRVLANSSALIVWSLTFAATAAAILLMWEAGIAEKKRRLRNVGSSGKAAIRWRVFAWLFLGVSAFFLRLAAPPPLQSTDLFADSGGGDSLFGEQSTEQTFQLLGTTFHLTELVPAVLMLAIFIAGGVGAYFLGKEMYNPLRLRYNRAKKASKKAQRRVMKVEGKLLSEQKKLDGLQQRAGKIEQLDQELELLRQLESKLEESHTEIQRINARREDLAEQRADLDELEAHHRAMSGDSERRKTWALEEGSRAKQETRVLLSTQLGSPASTSGVIDGYQAQATTERNHDDN